MAIKMYKNRTITAYFVESDAHYTLGIDVTPTDSGRIALKPPQPEEGYIVNKRITVTAIASAGYEFSHWEGDLTGSTNPVSILMDGDKTITAVFGAYYTLVVNTNPIGAGRVTLEPSQPAEGYFQGTRVTITAIARDGYRFDHWSGALSGTENPTHLTVLSNTPVAANFTKPFPWWVVAAVIGGIGSILIVGAFLLLIIKRGLKIFAESTPTEE